MSLRSALFLQEMGIAVQWQRKYLLEASASALADDTNALTDGAKDADDADTGMSLAKDAAMAVEPGMSQAVAGPWAADANTSSAGTPPVTLTAVASAAISTSKADPAVPAVAAPLLMPRVLVKPRIAEKPLTTPVIRPAPVSVGEPPMADSIPWASDEMPVLSADDYIPDAVPEWADFPQDDEPSREALIATMNWAQLQQAVASCTACGLCRQRQQSVFGRGSNQPLWLVVGDGPTTQDEAAAAPLSGDAGTLLENMLQASGRAQQVYITNLVKCRAQDEQGQPRAPTPQEITACRPFLQRQFTLLQPRLTLALGKTAALALRGPGAQASALRGSVHQAFGKPMVATWHPAFLLGQPLEKRQVWADLCLARSSDGSNEAARGA